MADYARQRKILAEIAVGKTSLKMSDGTIRKFKSKKARSNFERIAQAFKHGWTPDK